jgi:hypothetical protein
MEAGSSFADAVDQQRETVRQAYRIACFTFPDHANDPAHSVKGLCYRLIPRPVAPNLVTPVALVGLRDARAARAVMSVPETAVHKKRNPAGRKHQVGTAWQICPVKTETQTQRMSGAADGKLWARIDGLD